MLGAVRDIRYPIISAFTELTNLKGSENTFVFYRITVSCLLISFSPIL